MSDRAGDPSRATSTQVAAVAFAAAAPYVVALRAPFIFDDIGDIVDGATVHSVWPPTWTASTRPFAALTFAFNWVIGGANPLGFRVVNILIHVATALTLRALVVRLAQTPGIQAPIRDRARWVGTVAALLWAVHPIHTSAITYIVHRYESLASLLYLLALHAFVSASTSTSIDRRRPWIALAGFATALACLSKEIAVTLPCAALLIDRAFLSGSFVGALRRNFAVHATLVVTTVASLALALRPRGAPPPLGMHSSQGFHLIELTPVEYARSELGVVARYFRLIVWPRGLRIDYSDWPIARRFGDVVAFGSITIALVVVALILLVRAPRLGTIACWFFLLLAPTSSVVPLAGELVAERRLYLALAAPAVLIAIAVTMFASRRRAIVHALLAAAILALAVTTRMRNAQYVAPTELFGADARAAPKNARVCQNYGTTLSIDGQTFRALEEYRRCIAIDRASSAAYVSAVRAARELDLANPWSGAERADPAHAEAATARATKLIARADALLERGDRGGALAALRRASTVDPYGNGAYARITMLLGFAPNLTDADASEAIEAALRSWAISDSLDALVGAALGTCLAKTGRFELAVIVAEQLIAADDAAGLTQLANDQREALKLYRARERWVPGAHAR